MNPVRSADGTSIAYTQVGAGPALICVHGAVQYRAIDQVSEDMAALLEARFTVITYDRRGRGESGDAATDTVEREIEDLDALIHAVGGHASVFGESSGAVLALEAARRALPIDNLVCYEPPFIVDDTRDPLPADFGPRFDALVSAGNRADAFAMFMTIAAGLPAAAAAGISQDPMWPKLESVTHTIAYDRLIMGDTQTGNPAALAKFAGIQTPTLVLAGSESPAHVLNAAKTLADILPNAEHRVLPGEHHQFTAAGLAPAIAQFI
jgi:pimeloyl-ACP methyl ester carboxylesterase